LDVKVVKLVIFADILPSKWHQARNNCLRIIQIFA